MVKSNTSIQPVTNCPTFRCSSAHKLLTEPKLKSDKTSGKLSETAKTFIQEMWLQNTYGYAESVMTDEMMKGLICEQDSMALIQSVLGGPFRTRFNTRLKNDYIIGTPDVVLKNENMVEDIKTSWSLRTYMNAELLPAYYTQGQCYMWLTGLTNYRLIYALVPTPAEMILDEQKRLYYKFGCNEDNKDYQRMCEQIERNNSIIDVLPLKDRVKVFEFEFDANYIEVLKTKIEAARTYYEGLHL